MAQRATSLGPKPSLFIYFFVFVFFCSFPFFAFNRKTLFFPLKRAFFVYFLCFSFFLPQPFLTSPFFCFSFSVSLLLLSFFLPSCLSFLLSFCFLFLSLFHFSFFFAFVFWKEQHENFKLQFIFSSIFSLFYGFLSCFSFQIPFPYLCFFPDFKLCFCSTWMFLVSKQTT